MMDNLIELSYLVAAALFILSLRWLNHPRTARRGVAAGVAGMTAAIIGTLLAPEIVGYKWIAIALVVGIVAGVPLSWVPLTAVPQRTALSHAFGGLAAGLVGTAKYSLWLDHRAADDVPDVGDRARGDPRIPDLHRQPDGGGQAAGGHPDAADHLSQPEPRQPVAARARHRLGRLPVDRDRSSGRRSRRWSSCRSSSACC